MIGTIDKYVERPKRSYQEDGLVDAAAGITFLGVALIAYASLRSIATMHGADFTASSAYRDANGFFLFTIWAMNVMIFGAFRSIEPLKRRFVYPRTGYVQPRVVPQDRRRSFALVGCLLALPMFMYLWPSRFWISDASLILDGVAVGAALLYNFARFGFIRHCILAFLSVVTGVLLAGANLGWSRGTFMYALIMGTSLVISGAVSFARVLDSPVSAEQENA